MAETKNLLEQATELLKRLSDAIQKAQQDAADLQRLLPVVGEQIEQVLAAIEGEGPVVAGKGSKGISLSPGEPGNETNEMIDLSGGSDDVELFFGGSLDGQQPL